MAINITVGSKADAFEAEAEVEKPKEPQATVTLKIKKNFRW